MLVVVLCLALGTGVFWAVSGSCQTGKNTAGEQPGKSADRKGTLQPPAAAGTNQEMKAGQAGDAQKTETPPPKKARGAFNPTEGC